MMRFTLNVLIARVSRALIAPAVVEFGRLLAVGHRMVDTVLFVTHVLCAENTLPTQCALASACPGSVDSSGYPTHTLPTGLCLCLLYSVLRCLTCLVGCVGGAETAVCANGYTDNYCSSCMRVLCCVCALSDCLH